MAEMFSNAFVYCRADVSEKQRYESALSQWILCCEINETIRDNFFRDFKRSKLRLQQDIVMAGWLWASKWFSKALDELNN